MSDGTKLVTGLTVLGQIRVLILMIILWIMTIGSLIWIFLEYLKTNDLQIPVVYFVLLLLGTVILTVFFFRHQKTLKRIEEEQKKIKEEKTKK